MDHAEQPSASSIRTLLREGTRRVGRLDASVLLAHLLGKRREYLIAHDEEVLDGKHTAAYEALLAERETGIPVPYLTGTQEFFGRDFSVSPAVLIPRPDTETLVEAALARASDTPHILDLGTGSGCIAVTLACELPGARVTATDASAEALVLAETNARRLGARVRFLRGSWYEALPPGERFDLILSNPPYIREGDAHLTALRYEPVSALTAPEDGLADIKTIVEGAAEHLRPGGRLLLEHGFDQAEAVRALLLSAGFSEIATERDYGGNDRVTLGRRP